MPVLPDFAAARFDAGQPIDNPFFPLQPGTISSYAGSKLDQETGETKTESNDLFVTFETRSIEGVRAVVARDTAYADGVLVEDTLDWYAQDVEGNVWYLGEIAFSYEYDDSGNYIETHHDGSWEAGVEGALPGWLMMADATVGAGYYQEFFEGEAVDEAVVVAMDQQVEIGLGRFEGVLKTLDASALEPGFTEFKYYAQDFGTVLVEEGLDDGAVPNLRLELQGIRHVGGDAEGADLKPPKIVEFAGNGTEKIVTFVSQQAELNNALGAYSIDLSTGVIGEGRILFAETDDLAAGTAVGVEVSEGLGLGLFIIPDGAALGLDLTVFEGGGLFFSNILTGKTANVADGLAPLVANAAGETLPVHAFHALGAQGGFNFLNPVAGVQSVALEPDWLEDDDENGGTIVLGFEDQRYTQAGFDGDFDDLIVAVGDAPLNGLASGGGADELEGNADRDLPIGGQGADVLIFGTRDCQDSASGSGSGVDLVDLICQGHGFEDFNFTARSIGTEIGFGHATTLSAEMVAAEFGISDLVF